MKRSVAAKSEAWHESHVFLEQQNRPQSIYGPVTYWHTLLQGQQYAGLQHLEHGLLLPAVLTTSLWHKFTREDYPALRRIHHQ